MTWRDSADCARIISQEPDLRTAWDNIENGDWGYVPSPQADMAKAICDSCPVRAFCLIDAVEDEESDGLRAGFRFHMGKVSSREANRIRTEFNVRPRLLRQVPKSNESSTEV